MNASVKVMRSFDYCHFEIALSAEIEPTASPDDPDGTNSALDMVNDLRIQAALLVDEAVRQYKIAKEKEGRRTSRDYEKQTFLEQIARIEKIPQSEWSPEQAALMRAHADRSFWKQFDEEDYLYQYDPERDHHFSMLRKFQETRVSAALKGE